MTIVDLAFELIQVALGNREKLSRMPSEKEWEGLFDFAFQQTLVGVMLSGLERLPDEQLPPLEVKLEWIGHVQIIEQTNRVMNQQTEEVVKRLRQDGFDCVVLKGQGLAQLYPEPLRRMSGDIDVWVWPSDGLAVRGERLAERRDTIVKYLRSKGVNGRVVYHNVPVENWFEETEVEVHFTPSWMNNYFTNLRLQRWFSDERLAVSEIELCTGERIPVPGIAFNAVFVLQHIYRHLFGSGIGLRQMMDYYFVLRQVSEFKVQGSKDQVSGYRLAVSDDILHHTSYILHQLHMMKFAAAVMWVLKEVMGMPEEWMLCQPNEKEGRWLLSEILRAGNFGHYDDRIAIPENESKIHSFFRITRQNLRLLGHFPDETLWNPAYRAWHYCWRKVKGYPIS